MFTKALMIVFSVVVTTCYVLGFIYDASFLEEFGIYYYEMIGSPLDYLSIGGMYLFFSYIQHWLYWVLGLGIIGICYVPLKRKNLRDSLEKYVHIESVPYVILSLLPILTLVFLPVVSDAQNAASKSKAKHDDSICLKGKDPCIQGKVLRYRDSKIIFFEYESKETKVFPDKVVVSIKQG